MEEREKILSRIDKILKLSNDQIGTPEGQAAMDMAAMLMAKHEISMEEIRKSSKDDAFDRMVRENIICFDETKTWHYVEFVLMNGICTAFDCKMVATWNETGERCSAVMGRDADVKISIHFFKSCRRHIYQKATRMFTRRVDIIECATTAATEVGFRLAVINRKKQMQMQEAGSGSLIVLKKDQVQKFMDFHFNPESVEITKDKHHKGSVEAIQAGLKLGKEMSLHRPVTGSEVPNSSQLNG